jgi:hypothetical protein
MSLYHYLIRLETILQSRQDIEVINLTIEPTTINVKFKGEIMFYDKSRLIFMEIIQEVNPRQVKRVTYRFHYQDAHQTLIFRYDDAPHHPHLATFPHHKHVGSQVIEATPPDLSQIIAEIDPLIYPVS